MREGEDGLRRREQAVAGKLDHHRAFEPRRLVHGYEGRVERVAGHRREVRGVGGGDAGAARAQERHRRREALRAQLVVAKGPQQLADLCARGQQSSCVCEVCTFGPSTID